RMRAWRVPALPFGVDVGAGQGEVVAEAGLGSDVIEPSHRLDGDAQRAGNAADFLAQSSQYPANFAFLLALENDALRAEVGHGGWLDEHGLPRAAGAVAQARHLVTEI